MDGNLMQEVLQAVNAGATSLNSNTLANVNAMNVELHNADGSLAGKYTLSNFLENVIYQFLATTKASALASVLGVFGAKTLSDLGITTPCRVRDIIAAMPLGASVSVEITTTEVTDGRDGCLYIFNSAKTGTSPHKALVFARMGSQSATVTQMDFLVGIVPYSSADSCAWYKPTMVAV